MTFAAGDTVRPTAATSLTSLGKYVVVGDALDGALLLAVPAPRDGQPFPVHQAVVALNATTVELAKPLAVAA